MFGFSTARIVIALGIMLAIASGSFWAGWDWRDARAARDRNADIVATFEESQRQAKIAMDAVQIADGITLAYGVQAAKAERLIQTRTVTLIRKVPEYVSPAIDAATVIPWGFVRFFDAGWAGAADPATVPIAPGQSDSTASDVRLSEIATVSATNAGACYENAGHIEALQGWVRDIKAWADKVQAAYAARPR
jgi:hypothetical protein